jgi:hypothetical protein
MTVEQWQFEGQLEITTASATVPEPTTMLLLGFSVIGLAGLEMALPFCLF